MKIKKTVWKLSDSTNNVVGYFFKEDGEMKLQDLSGNKFTVPSNMTLKQAVRVMLNKQMMSC
jgi:hypothetical protein